MPDTVPTAEPADEYARGWNAAVRRIGDLMVSIDGDTYRAAVNALYLRIVGEGVRGPHLDPEVAHSPLVAAAVDAIDEASAFACVDRAQAVWLLAAWPPAGELTPAEWDAVLRLYRPSVAVWLSGPCVCGCKR